MTCCYSPDVFSPHQFSDAFGFFREKVSYSRGKIDYLNAKGEVTAYPDWYSPSGNIERIWYHDSKLNLIGYIPIIGIYATYNRFGMVSEWEKEGLMPCDSLKGALIFRGLVEFCGFGAIFFVIDIIVWIGREINYYRLEGTYNIMVDSKDYPYRKVYPSTATEVQSVKKRILEIRV